MTDLTDLHRSDYRVTEIQGTMTVYDLPQPYSIAFSAHPVLPFFSQAAIIVVPPRTIS